MQSMDLLYAAIKSVKIPDLTLDPGTYEVNASLRLQGIVSVGMPTFFTPSQSFNYDDICTLAFHLGVPDNDLLKALKILEKVKKDDRASTAESYRKVREYHHKQKEKHRKPRKGSISGNITVHKR